MPADSNKAFLGAIISFFLPGLGLVLSKEQKLRGIILFLGAMVVDFVCVV